MDVKHFSCCDSELKSIDKVLLLESILLSNPELKHKAFKFKESRLDLDSVVRARKDEAEKNFIDCMVSCFLQD